VDGRSLFLDDRQIARYCRQKAYQHRLIVYVEAGWHPLCFFLCALPPNFSSSRWGSLLAAQPQRKKTMEVSLTETAGFIGPGAAAADPGSTLRDRLQVIERRDW
jgi:hypothetical protein